MDDYGTAGAMAMIAGLGFFLLIAFAIIIVLYVLLSIGLMKMAENLEIENAWLAWVPIANLYILGKIVGDIRLFGNTIPYTEWILVGTVFINFVPVIGQILSFIGIIYLYIVLYNLYKMYSDGKETLYTVLTVIFHVYPILIFVLRNNQRKEIVVE